MAKNRKYQHRSRETVEGFEPLGNPELSRAMLALNSSNAAQRYPLLKHKRPRNKRKSTAIREQREL